MDFEIACTCGQNMIVDSQLVGQDVQCPGCGSLLAVPPVPHTGDPVPVVWPRSADRAPEPPPVPPTIEFGYSPVPPLVRRTNGKAIASLVCSIVGLATCPVGPVILSTIAIVLGGQAKREIILRPQAYGGLGLAIAGQALGALGLMLSLGSCLLTGCLGLFRHVNPF